MARKSIKNVVAENVENVNVIENEKENEIMENTVVENVVAENVENVVIEKENVQMENTVVTAESIKEEYNSVTVEQKRNDILTILMLERAKLSVYEDINKKGKEINPTNWAKEESGRGNATIGGYVRQGYKDTAYNILNLKIELKATYFNVDPVMKELQASNNPGIVDLVNDALDRMSNVIVLAEMFDTDIIKAFYNAGLEEIGVSENMLGYALPLLAANGYVMDLSKPRPVVVEDINIEGLDYIPSYKYFSFKRA